mmetsp:Transcript_34861/g.82277  ORF Transcript_34861/g.82277 Transcript_34861/m.82277 type:complete len:257 (-) Transcript_34861:636-1406(-)
MECLLRTNMRQNLQVGRPGRPGRARVLGAAHTCENRRAVIGSVVQTALPTKNPRDCLDHGQGLHVGRPTPTSSSSCSRRSYSAESGSEIARTTCCSVVHAARHGLHQPAQQLRHVRHRQHRRRLGAVRGGARHLQEGRAAPRGGQGAHRLHLVHRARDRVCRAHRRGGGLGDARQGAAAAAARQGGDAVLAARQHAEKSFATSLENYVPPGARYESIVWNNGTHDLCPYLFSKTLEHDRVTSSALTSTRSSRRSSP